MDLNINFATLDDDALSEYAEQVRTAFDALAGLDDPTIEQITEAEGLADHLDAITSEQGTRLAAEAERQTRAAALRTRFSTEASEGEAEGEEDEDEEDGEEEAEVGGDPQEQAAEVVAAAPKGVAVLATKVRRPAKPPALQRVPVSITAAADVPEFATGSRLEDMTRVGVATVNRMKGFGTPNGTDDGSNPNWQHYGVASFSLNFPPELTIDRHSDDQEVLTYAASEKRLPGGSLVAAGGWCAPSETIYDLCPGASTDGMLSIPEVAVNRGGIKYTRGPDFSALYSAGFCQTEAQAISGTTKPCYDVPCPTFTEVRLDACGICIRVPILTNAAYPELIAATLREALIAHQHAMNARVLASLQTLLGTAVAYTGLGAVSTDTLEALLIAGANIRQQYRLPINESLEVVLPYWARDVLFVDFARRTDSGATASGSDVDGIFSAANLSVQYVYDWEELPADSTAWPTELPALIYPAGSFVKGTTSVISMNAVYDSAGLSTNTYTGLFFEEGILVAPMCRDGVAITVPVCTAGRTGINDLTCTVGP